MATLWDKVRGTIETIFQLGLGGPQFKANANQVDVVNATNTGFVTVSAADPTIADHLVTKRYSDAHSGSGLGGGVLYHVPTGTTKTVPVDEILLSPAGSSLIVDGGIVLNGILVLNGSP